MNGISSSDQIAADLEQTRVEIDDTLSQLQVRLSPARMIERARTWVTENPLLSATLGLALATIVAFAAATAINMRNTRPRGERRTIDEHTRLRPRSRR
jgi:Protein of unknown function (DUF3618)